MNDLFHGFEFISAHIDKISILTKGDCIDHVHKLELTHYKSKIKNLNAILKSNYLDKLKWNINIFG